MGTALLRILLLCILIGTIGCSSGKEGKELSLRKKPKPSAKRLTRIPKGADWKVLEKSERTDSIDGKEGAWFKAAYQGETGYIFSGFLEDEQGNPVHPIAAPTLVLYFPKIERSDYEEQEGLAEVAGDFNHYSSKLLKVAKDHDVQIIELEERTSMVVTNGSDSKSIQVPTEEHEFGYIFIKEGLSHKARPGIDPLIREHFLEYFGWEG